MGRTGQGNLIRCTPVLDERYVPGDHFDFSKWTAGRQMAYSTGALLRNAKESTCARDLVPHFPLVFPTRPVELGATFRLGTGGWVGLRTGDGRWGDGDYRDCECCGSTALCAGMLVAVSQMVSCRSLGGLWGLWVSIWTGR